MEPVTLIVTALAAGAASALQDGAKDAVKVAYARLRDRVRQRFAGDPAAELVLAEHGTTPQTWDAPLAAKLIETGAADDSGLVDAARVLMIMLDEAGARSGKYDVSINASQGLQVGDHNTQTNIFGPA
jgi:hypothetical protein